MAFFQFDELRKIAKFAINHDLKTTTRKPLAKATGLPFLPDDDSYRPWRNYARVFRTAMLVADINGVARPTRVAQLLARDGAVTSDAYFHFFVQAFSDPHPSFEEWDASVRARFPLLFVLKFLLARAVVGSHVVSYEEVISAYEQSGFVGGEDQARFIKLARKSWAGSSTRQARESIRALSQITYLSSTSKTITVSLHSEDALNVFAGLGSLAGSQKIDADDEIMRRAALFEHTLSDLDLDYSATVVDQTVEAGFTEGSRVERTHVLLERNHAVRAAFFQANPTAECEVCGRDTRSEFPWTERVLDIHHVLPLCSGTRASGKGTVLTDLVAICPTCHRAIHRFYAKWMKTNGRKDFSDGSEARMIYDQAKDSRCEP